MLMTVIKGLINLMMASSLDSWELEALGSSKFKRDQCLFLFV